MNLETESHTMSPLEMAFRPCRRWTWPKFVPIIELLRINGIENLSIQELKVSRRDGNTNNDRSLSTSAGLPRDRGCVHGSRWVSALSPSSTNASLWPCMAIEHPYFGKWMHFHQSWIVSNRDYSTDHRSEVTTTNLCVSIDCICISGVLFPHIFCMHSYIVSLEIVDLIFTFLPPFFHPIKL